MAHWRSVMRVIQTIRRTGVRSWRVDVCRWGVSYYAYLNCWIIDRALELGTGDERREKVTDFPQRPVRARTGSPWFAHRWPPT